MADIYDRARASAARMLAPRPAGKGLGLTITRADDGGAYVPGGGTTGGTTQIYTGSGVRVDYKLSDIDGVSIVKGDYQLLLSPDVTGEPKRSDSVQFDGSSLTVIDVQPWNYAGVVCGYRLQVRG